MSNWVWADLPEAFVERISDLCLPPDSIRMQSVCKSWQLILKKRRKRELPWLMMQNEADPDALDFFSISQQKLHTIHFPEIRHKRCIGSFKNGWLIILDKKQFRIHLFHPWSRIELQLPCLFTSTLRRPNYVSDNYVADFLVDNRGTVLIQKKFRDPLGRVSKVALSDDGNMVVAINGCGELAFCRIGDKAWTHIESPRWMNHIQIIYHKGQFYAMEYQGPISHLLIEDNFIPHVAEVAKVPHFEDDHDGRAYFVGDILTECLFVVFREVKYDYESSKFITTGFHIYEVVPSLNKVREVKSLADRIMFLGCNSSLIVMAREFPSFKGNCIYFANTYDFSDVHQIYDSGVFNCEDGTIEPPLVDWCHHPTTLWPPLWIAIPPYSLYSDFREKDVIGTIAGVIIMSDKRKSKETDDIDRAHWSDGMRKCIIDICLEQVRASGHPGLQFSSKAWKMIIQKFTQRTGHSFNQKQLKNQLDHLKKLNNAWLHLTSLTGIGFNPHTGCVEMAHDRWTEYLKTHKDAKVFRSKPLPFPQEIAALFDGTSTTGDDKWAPTMDGVPKDIIMDMDSSFVSLNGYDDTPSPNQINSQSTMQEDATTSDIGPDVMMANIRRKRPRPSTKGRNNAVDDCIIELAASMKASNQLAAASAQSKGPTMEACIDLLHAMPQLLETSPLHMVALRSFMVKEKRIIWTKFKTDEGKITWLKYLMEIEKGNAVGVASDL